MNPVAAVWDFLCFLNIVARAGGPDQGMWTFEGEIDYLTARIEDSNGALFFASAQQGIKRKREDAYVACVAKNQELVLESRSLLGQDGEESPKKKRKVKEQSIWSFHTCTKLVSFQRLIKRLSAHENEAGMLLNNILFDGRGPSRGNLIPARKLFGEAASVALNQLQALLQGNEVGRIAIHGIKGIGKTFLMKHLHNSVLKWDKRFDYVFWVTCPHQFSIKCLQDAVAAAVKCKLCSDDSVIRRAEILSGIFAGLGSFVIFLDDVPEVCFSLAQIGIPEGSESKLVLTSRSTLVPEMLDCYRTAIDRLSDEEAFQLFMNEARISRSAPLPESISRLLANNCHGVPHKIIDVATQMRGIHDPYEWNHKLFEFTRSSKG